nr:hypothetical protein [Actinoplanes aureus]
MPVGLLHGQKIGVNQPSALGPLLGVRPADDLLAQHDYRADRKFPGLHPLLGHTECQRDEFIGGPGIRHAAIFPHVIGGEVPLPCAGSP